MNTRDKIAVDITELQEMLSLGKNKALQFGAEAGAKFKYGKRSLYRVDKILAYIDSLMGGAKNE